MTKNHCSEAEWQTLDDEIQARFRALVDEIGELTPSVLPRFGKTVTDLFPLFSYVSFRRPHAKVGEYIIVGVDIAHENGQWRIHADVSDEEEGTIFFELPRTPFSVATFEELRKRVLARTDELIAYGKPLLVQLCASTVTPPSQPFDSTASIAEDRRR